MSKLAITRVNNSCVLLELNGHTVLTDPWFTEYWHLHRDEPLGLTVEALPPLTAIVASRPVPNHWDLRSLRKYPHKAAPHVLVATARMARQARGLGYGRVEHLRWGEIREVAPDLVVESVPSGRIGPARINAYLLSSGGLRVLFGGEIREVALLAGHHADVALLPVNGLRVPLGPRLVMDPARALAGAKVLGAKVLVTIHDAHANDPLYFMVRRRGSGKDAAALALADPAAPEVVNVPTGRRWELAS